MKNCRGNWKYINVALSEESHTLLEKARSAYQNKVPKSHIIALAWPRCPSCNSPLIQKFASKRLVCTGCGKEFELCEVP